LFEIEIVMIEYDDDTDPNEIADDGDGMEVKMGDGGEHCKEYDTEE